tara:strand:+ start:45 stop:1532 length:1488 start_codon:yes stop_codon:yes gene_type:complete
MAKLYGTADATIVNAAFRYGRSNVAKDMEKVYAQRTAISREFATDISKAYDKLYEEHNLDLDKSVDLAGVTRDKLTAGTFSNDHMLDMNEDIVQDFRKQFDALDKKDNKGRARLMAKINNYHQNMQNSGEMFQSMVSNSANNKLLSDLSSDERKLFNLIMEDGVNNTSVTKGTYDNEINDITYTLPGTDVTMTMGEINKRMTAHNPEFLAAPQKIFTDFQEYASKKKGLMTAQDGKRLKKSFNDLLVGDDQIRMVANEKFGDMDFSFQEVLTGQAKDPQTGELNTELINIMYDELDKLGGIDVNNDNKIDEADDALIAEARKNNQTFVTGENGFSLIEELKKDKSKYRDLLSSFLVKTAADDFYGMGIDQRKTSKQVGPGGNVIINGANLKRDTFNATYGLFAKKIHPNNVSDGLYSSPSGKSVKVAGGKYYVVGESGEFDMENPVTYRDIAVMDGWSNYVEMPQEKQQYEVGKEYKRGGKTFRYNEDGSFTEIK